MKNFHLSPPCAVGLALIYTNITLPILRICGTVIFASEPCRIFFCNFCHICLPKTSKNDTSRSKNNCVGGCFDFCTHGHPGCLLSIPLAF